MGASDLAQADRQADRAADFQSRADAATAAGEDADRFQTLADNLMRAADRSREAAYAAAVDASGVLLLSLGLLLVLRFVQGFSANRTDEAQYSRWRVAPASVPSGRTLSNLLLGIALGLVVIPLKVYRFITEGIPEWITEFPADPDLYSCWARSLEDGIDNAARNGAGTFVGIVLVVR